MVHHAVVGDYASCLAADTIVFDPEFLAGIVKYRSLRFMVKLLTPDSFLAASAASCHNSDGTAGWTAGCWFTQWLGLL